jgi:signal transduction histidine kinase
MNNTLRILCLEDDEEDFIIIKNRLQKSGLLIDMKRVDTREMYVDGLRLYYPDLVLSDHSLPQFNSTEALKLSKSMLPQIPFILVTGAVSDEFAVNCIKLGADDYVLKSNLARLPSAIKNALKHKETENAKIKATVTLANRNEELLKINNELDSFVYSVSHNLRAPLMSVLGLINLSKRETDIQNLRHYNQLMETSIHKLDDTLKEIIDYSRNARQDLQIELVDVRKVIEETLRNMQFIAGFGQMEIKVSVDDNTAFWSDYYRLSVIITNLISNAIKYRDERKEKSLLEIVVTITSESAEIVFTDNGIGIDKTLLPKIFDMFFRANTTREGSGLGLYIVKEAVEKLRGTVTIDSALGAGTSFTFIIPNHGNGRSSSPPPSPAGS